MPTSVSEIQTQALNERNDEVKKELVKKYKVIAKRRGVLTNHVSDFEAKVTAFENDVAAASTPEAISAALAKHKFPYNIVNLQGTRE